MCRVCVVNSLNTYITCGSYAQAIQKVRISEENIRFYKFFSGALVFRTDTEHFEQFQSECISPFDILDVIHSNGIHINISGAQFCINKSDKNE